MLTIGIVLALVVAPGVMIASWISEGIERGRTILRRLLQGVEARDAI